jgi:hypothetical protein
MRNFGKADGGGRRIAAREQLPLLAVFSTRVRTGQALLVDLSKTGAKLRGHNLPEKDEDLALNVEGVTTFGWVAWSRMGYCGITFDSALATDNILKLERLVERARGLPPELMSALDDWERGLAR